MHFRYKPSYEEVCNLLVIIGDHSLLIYQCCVFVDVLRFVKKRAADHFFAEICIVHHFLAFAHHDM
jgi:hypothetical protein